MLKQEWKWMPEPEPTAGCRIRKGGQRQEKGYEGLGARACLVEAVVVAELGSRLNCVRMPD